MNTISNVKTLKLVQLALFTAIIVIMAFTPIGYIKISIISITMIVIPVTVGAVVMGPVAGAILGGVFGATSFIQCFGMDWLGTQLFNINPILTLILTMVPRILMGWLAGLLFYRLKRIRRMKGFSYIVTSLSGALLNTILFTGTFILFFYRSDFVQTDLAVQLESDNIIAFIIAFVGLNGVVEAAVCCIVGSAIAKTIHVVYKKSSYEG